MIKKYKHVLIILGLILIGIILISYSSLSNKSSEKSSNDYVKELERKIEEFLLNVDGIFEVDVILTVKNDYYASITDGFDVSSYVCGAAIACTNGDDPSFRYKLTRLISAYLGLPSNRIEIVRLG